MSDKKPTSADDGAGKDVDVNQLMAETDTGGRNPPARSSRS